MDTEENKGFCSPLRPPCPLWFKLSRNHGLVSGAHEPYFASRRVRIRAIDHRGRRGTQRKTRAFVVLCVLCALCGSSFLGIMDWYPAPTSRTSRRGEFV